MLVLWSGRGPNKPSDFGETQPGSGVTHSARETAGLEEAAAREESREVVVVGVVVVVGWRWWWGWWLWWWRWCVDFLVFRSDSFYADPTPVGHLHPGGREAAHRHGLHHPEDTPKYANKRSNTYRERSECDSDRIRLVLSGFTWRQAQPIRHSHGKKYIVSPESVLIRI